jgi:hypothetical protein
VCVYVCECGWGDGWDAGGEGAGTNAQTIVSNRALSGVSRHSDASLAEVLSWFPAMRPICQPSKDPRQPMPLPTKQCPSPPASPPPTCIRPKTASKASCSVSRLPTRVASPLRDSMGRQAGASGGERYALKGTQQRGGCRPLQLLLASWSRPQGPRPQPLPPPPFQRKNRNESSTAPLSSTSRVPCSPTQP